MTPPGAGPVRRCMSVSPDGMQCGMRAGHGGRHNALVETFPMDWGDPSPKETTPAPTLNLAELARRAEAFVDVRDHGPFDNINGKICITPAERDALVAALRVFSCAHALYEQSESVGTYTEIRRKRLAQYGITDTDTDTEAR